MGEKFVNYQIRSNSINDVTDIVKSLTEKQAYISPPKNGWITVYDQTSERLRYDEINSFAQKISASLSTVVFSIVVFSGLHFIYLLHESGEIIDEFYEDPEGLTFGYKYVNNEILKRFRGNPNKLLKHCVSEVTLEAISLFFNSCREHKRDYLGQDAAYEFSLLLGIDPDRAIIGYKYFLDNNFNSEFDPDLDDAQDFILVKSFKLER